MLSVSFVDVSSILFCLSSTAAKRLLNLASPPDLCPSSKTSPAVPATLKVEGLA